MPTRRTFFHTAGAAGLASAISLAVPALTHAAPPLEADDFDTLRQRWVDQLTGRTLITPGDPTVEAVITEIDEKADDHLARMAPAGSGRVFTDLAYAAEANITATMERLAHLAKAWATPGSAHHNDTATRERVIAALRDVRSDIYHPSQPEYGNWWVWEIGVPRALADTMAILREHLTAEDISAFSESIDFYVPDPWQQFPPERGRITSEGANRVDLCQAVIIRSIVAGDGPRLAHAIDGLSAVWQTVEEGNGFYPDGSFIQHSTIAYTGTYGVVLLRGLSTLFALLADTSQDIEDPSRSLLTDAVERSFAPLIHEGRMMDAVRGRAISRAQERSLDNGNTVIEAILRLAAAVDTDTATRWRGLCRSWIEDNPDPTILTTGPLARLALASELMAADVAPRRLPTGPSFFPRMDRLVYRGDDGWATCLALCSDRIAWYECGNGENEHGSLTSQGMTYLYLPQDDGHFDDEFWATCDLQGLPGTTVDTTPLPARVEGQWGEATPGAEWAGGTTLGEVALAGQHLVAPGDTGLTARRTWLLLPHAIVTLASDVGSGTDAEVKTVIEHRNLGTAARRQLLDGDEVGGEDEGDAVVSSDSTWAHLDGVGGYVLLEPAQLRAGQADLEGSWSRNNTGGSEETVRRRYATLEVIHSAERPTCAYVVLPGADPERTADFASAPEVEVVRNDESVQAVRSGQLLAANFWQSSRAQHLTAHGPACVLLQKTGRGREISVSDPTHRQNSVRLTLAGTSTLRPLDTDRVKVSDVRGGIDITVDTSGLGGQPVAFSLAP